MVLKLRNFPQSISLKLEQAINNRDPNKMYRRNITQPHNKRGDLEEIDKWIKDNKIEVIRR